MSNNAIFTAASLIDNMQYDKAIKIINSGLSSDSNNYELIFMRAICHEQLNCIEDAYFEYRLAAFIAKSSSEEDEKLINEHFKHMCSYANADGFKLGRALENLITERLQLKEYIITYEFLKLFIYDTNKFSANITLTEKNMLLLMMLEIYECECSHNEEDTFDDIFKRYGNTYDNFKVIYYELKLVLRRVWFGMDYEKQMELTELIGKYNISPDMLAILTKYCIEERCWCDAFDKIAHLLENVYPKHSLRMADYSEWLSSMNTGNQCKCMPYSNYDNNAQVTYLDCKKYAENISTKTNISYSKVLERNTDNNRFSIIFCTNNDMYASECIMYLKKLQVPANMKLDIIAVINASGMAAGYNTTMNYSNAKYKLYIHHDTFIVDHDILNKLINVFKANENIGMIGDIGTTNMPPSAKWFNSDIKYLRENYYNDNILYMFLSMSKYKNGTYEHADGIDGIFMATSYDIPWREDIFDNWHYYDISQTYEFRKAGLETVFINSTPIPLLHEPTATKDPLNLYDKYSKIFIANYLQ